MYPQINVLGSPITALCFEEQIALLLDWAQKRESRVTCVANVHMVMEATCDPEFAAVLKEADLVTPDGMPLVWLMRRLGAPSQERVAGMDMLPALCKRAEEQGISIFFLGSTQEVLDRIRKRLELEHPRLAIAGMESPPFRPLTESEQQALIEKINGSGAQMVFVALGCPKQERWMHFHKEKILAPMVGLGGAFPVYAGVQRRAPLWVQRAGLEWVFRLLQDPGRLWKRYWGTNLPFMWLAARQLLARTER